MNGETAFPPSKCSPFPNVYPQGIFTLIISDSGWSFISSTQYCLKYDKGCAEAYPDDER